MNKKNFIHGYASKRNKHSLYNIWNSIKQRCLNTNNYAYKNYGGRGITISDRWLKFELFLSDVLDSIGPHPGNGYTFDRIDNNGNYELNNMQWSTTRQQTSNKRNTIRNVKTRNVISNLTKPIYAALFQKDMDKVNKIAETNHLPISYVIRLMLHNYLKQVNDNEKLWE
jgi:hypothetical protein